MLTSKTLKGNWGTLLLPINADDSIDYGRLSEEIGQLIDAGLDGIYSNGTAGEFHNQTETEFDMVQEVMAERCRAAGMPFQIGASHPSPVVSLERVRRCVALSPDAFQVILPDWVVATGEEQVVFLRHVAEAADGIPLVLYNPPHAKQVLAPAGLARLRGAVPSLIGVKLASGDASWFAEMRALDMDMSVFVPGHLLATGVRERVASGAYSNVACLSPRGSQAWWQLILADPDKALGMQERILQFFATCIVPFKNAGYSNPALDKFLAAVGGWGRVGTRLRWPYKWIDEKEVAGAREVAMNLLPEFFLNVC
ncbi:MAG: dihydrodipicolinate synthase family protein [Bacteroidetes bacterium]|nr:dihydrodipicolinate synthase family protein [Bacteroidota bacterium]